jgi:hypothetical protein
MSGCECVAAELPGQLLFRFLNNDKALAGQHETAIMSKNCLLQS